MLQTPSKRVTLDTVDCFQHLPLHQIVSSFLTIVHSFMFSCFFICRTIFFRSSSFSFWESFVTLKSNSLSILLFYHIFYENARVYWGINTIILTSTQVIIVKIVMKILQKILFTENGNEKREWQIFNSMAFI